MLLGFVAQLSSGPCRADQIEFNQHIRPILSDRCFQCHGPDDKKRESDIRFDIETDAKKDIGGYHAIAPGEPEKSALIERIFSDDPDAVMPPPESGKSLSRDEIALLEQWIAQGASFEEHWAFQSVAKTVPPTTEDSIDWPQGDIDRFIFARLAQEKLEPSPPADRNTLLRRLSLDLTGLLPTAAEVDAFVNDESDNAYEKVVDRLLASKHFGERIGRHWLDLARYADSNGYANDGLRSIWPYRDWVIQALNDDMPFDQFTIEQLAGDLLDEPTESQIVATGFNRNTPLQTEGGSDYEQYRVERTKNRTDTTGAVWLGLTVGCAQCHSHKFDPITHEEYYQLYAFFNNADEPTRSLEKDSVKDEIDDLKSQVASLEIEIAQQQEIADAEKDSGTATEVTSSGKTVSWRALEFETLKSEGGATLKRLPDRSILASGKNPDRDTYLLSAKLSSSVQAIRIETLTDSSLPKNGPGRAGNGNFVLADFSITSNDQPAGIASAMADHSQKGYPVTAAFDGIGKSGWAINVSKGKMNVNRNAIFALDRPIESDIHIAMTAYEQGNGYNIGRFRISVSEAIPDSMPEPVGNSKVRKLESQKSKLQEKIKSIEKSLPKTLVMSERAKPRESFIQLRGDFLDPGAMVRPATFSVLHPFKSQRTEPNRLDLAHWLMSAENPLTPRVHVNRIWQHLFGVGLVETENDFGYQGSLPSHPQLLDYLAEDFIKGGWKQKRIYKKIVMSATYRQSSNFRADLYAVDAKNRWLGRQNRFRVEGEVVRDVALAASGLLSTKMGGPSVFPPIPPNVIGTSSARHRWPESKGEDRYRRGVYTAIYRANVYPMLLAFDGPDRDNACTRRSRSNTPLQALTIANDSAFMEMAVAFGKRIMKTQGDQQRVQDAFVLAFSRLPTSDEAERVIEFQNEREAFYRENIDQAKLLCESESAELASWVAVARVLMNLDEFITRE